jgi:hypothetical protein
MKLLRIWGNVKRPWGYEVRADYDQDGRIINEVLTWPDDPGEAKIVVAVEARRVLLESQYAEAAKAKPRMELESELATVQAEVNAVMAKKADLEAKLSAITVAESEPIGEAEPIGEVGGGK